MKILSLVQGCALALAFPLYSLCQAGPSTTGEFGQEGQQALAAGRYDLAQADFEKLAALEPGVAEVHATLAVIYFKQRQYELAVREITTAKKLKPTLPKLDSLMGVSLAELGRFHDALPGLEKGFKQTADPEVRRMCGLQLLRTYTGLNRNNDAVEVALALNKDYPTDPEILYHTGRIYGNIAYVVMETLHDEAPNSIWMLQAQGEADESQKDYEGAIAAYNHLIALVPRRPGIHYRLGRVYLRRFADSSKPEDRDAAIREFTAELTVDPGHGNASYELAKIQADQGNLDEAQKDFQQVLDHFPDFEEALVGLGGVLLQAQKAELALPPLERATKLRPVDKVAWYRLALAQRGVGNREALQSAMARYQELSKAEARSAPKPPSAEDVTPQEVDANAQQ